MRRYYSTVTDSERLITDYRCKLVEDHHHPGSGRYGGQVLLQCDISPCFPYLNAVLDDTWYDHENQVLIGCRDGHRYAFRPHDIRLSAISGQSDLSTISATVTALVNQVWAERHGITPSLVQRKRPAVYDLFKSLPRTNCKRCGYPTCLAFAADLSAGRVRWDACPLLSQAEYAGNREKIVALFGAP